MFWFDEQLSFPIGSGVGLSEGGVEVFDPGTDIFDFGVVVLKGPKITF